MITQDMYKNMLGIREYGNPQNQQGVTISQARKRKSAQIFNATFTNDVGYKKVYVLTPDKGWQWMDAKYSKHQTPTQSTEDVDYYLQFRPTYETGESINYEIGTYVFIPNEDRDDIPFDKDDEDYPNPKYPIEQLLKNYSPYEPLDGLWDNIWIIAFRDYDTEFIRYSVIKCNHVFRWIYNKKIYDVVGISRTQSSYTAGTWLADYTMQLDNTTAAILPNLHYVYGDKLAEYKLDNPDYLLYQTRFMISTNKLQPKVYQTTKIMEDKPKGLILLTFKQDEYDEKRDNTDLFCCNYYDDNGEAFVDVTPAPSEPSDADKCELYQCTIDDNGETVRSDTVEPLHLGQTTYFECEYGSEDYKSTWKIECIDDVDNETKEYLESMLKLTIFDDENVSVKVSRVNSVIGHTFKLTVTNDNNINESASIELGVEK